MRPLSLALLACLLPAPSLPQQRSPGAPPLVLVVVGPPGSGKTVQSRHLAKRYGIPAIALSDLLTESLGKRGTVPQALKAQVASGELVSDALANDLVKARLGRPDAGRGFILDGYPRTAAQAEVLDAFLQAQRLPAPKVLALDAPDAIVRQRLGTRKRADDDPATIDRRLLEFHDEFRFLSDWYKPANLLRVDATQPIPVVTRQVNDLVDEALSKHSFSIR